MRLKKGALKQVNWSTVTGIGVFTGPDSNLTVIDVDDPSVYPYNVQTNVDTKKGFHIWCDYNGHIQAHCEGYDIKSKGNYVELVTLSGAKIFNHGQRHVFASVMPPGHEVKTKPSAKKAKTKTKPEFAPTTKYSSYQQTLQALVSKNLLPPLVTWSYLQSLGWKEKDICHFVKDVKYFTSDFRAEGIEQVIGNEMFLSWIEKYGKIEYWECRQHARFRAKDCWRREKGYLFKMPLAKESELEYKTEGYIMPDNEVDNILEVLPILSDKSKQLIVKIMNNEHVAANEYKSLREDIRRKAKKLEIDYLL